MALDVFPPLQCFWKGLRGVLVHFAVAIVPVWLPIRSPPSLPVCSDFLFLREPVLGGFMFLGICPLFPGCSARICCSVVITCACWEAVAWKGLLHQIGVDVPASHFWSALSWAVRSPLNSCLHPCRGAPTQDYAGLPKDELSQESPFSGVEMGHLCCGYQCLKYSSKMCF